MSKKRDSSFSTIVVFACLFLAGVLLTPLLPVKLNPSNSLPEINVYFSMSGQSARVVETEVTSKLEAMLSRIKGVENVRSRSSAGSGSVTLRLSKHVSPDMARFEAATIVRQMWSSMPEGISYPQIYMSGTSDENRYPFLRYSVNAPLPPAAIRHYIDNSVATQLAEIKGIDKIEAVGASPMIYRLEYDNAQLQTLGVSTNDIRDAVQSFLAKESFGTGIVENSGEKQYIRLALAPQNHSDKFNPADVLVKNIDGKIIYLNQIVTTTYEEEELSSYFRINGLNSIYLSFTATAAANRLTLSQEIREKLAEMQFPAGYQLHLLYDESDYLQQEMNKIYFRSGLTVLILLVFVLLVYRNLKYSLVILLSLIANLGIAAAFYYLLKLEMQLYSLAGLTISLTIIIDNAIVMSDQILNRGNRKAFLAILTATLTTILSLIVILFMDEKIRANLQDFALVIMVNLAVSLFVALFLVPALINAFHLSAIAGATRNPLKKKKRWLLSFNRVYSGIILFIRRFRVAFVVLLVLAFGLPVFLLPEKIDNNNLYNSTLGSTFYKEKIKPYSDMALGGALRLFVQKVKTGGYSSGERSETALFVTASLPYGSTKEQMDNIIKKMERYIVQFREVRQFETHIENGQRASIRIYFVKQHQRSSFPYRLKSDLISKSIEIGGGSWSVYGLGDGFSNDVKEQAGGSRIKLLGYNYDELTARAEALRDSLQQYRRIEDVTIDSKFSWYKDDYTEFAFALDRERMAQENLYPNQIFGTLTPLFARNVNVGEIAAENHSDPIRLYSRQAATLDLWNMEHFAARSDDKEFRINTVGNIVTAQTPADIAKENQQYLLCVQYDYIGAYEQAWKVSEREIKKFNDAAPLGYKAETETSRYWWGDKDNSTQYLLLLLIIVIIYVTTSILFNSLTQPLVIISIIPLSYIGLFLTFYLFNLNFDQGGYAAFILLTGISVNANIYLLNEYNNIRQKKPLLTPLKTYLKAWNAKIRPIFLTVISTVLGFIPFIIGYKEAFWFPLAVGSMGGLVFSFMAMWLFLPLLKN